MQPTRWRIEQGTSFLNPFEQEMLLHFCGRGPLHCTVYTFGRALKNLKRLGYVYERGNDYVVSQRGQIACQQMLARTLSKFDLPA